VFPPPEALHSRCLCVATPGQGSSRMDASSPTLALPTSPRERLFVRLLLLLFVGLSIQYSLKVLDHRGAVTRWREQLLNWQDGENIYDRFVYPNPPIMALLLLPLANLPPLAGALLWFYLKAGMTLLVLCWVLRLVEGRGRPFPFWGKALAVGLSLRPIMGDLYHGNINVFILFL